MTSWEKEAVATVVTCAVLGMVVSFAARQIGGAPAMWGVLAGVVLATLTTVAGLSLRKRKPEDDSR